MATSKEYAYYIKGNKIAIVQKDYTSSGGQTLSQPGLNDLGGVGALFWKSPKESITDGLELQYVYSPTSNPPQPWNFFNETWDGTTSTWDMIIDEKHESFELDIPRYLANGLVYYVKAKYAEDAGEIEKKEYFMREFRRITEKHQSSKKLGTYITQGFSLFRS